MKEARYLIRLKNDQGHQPQQQASLLRKARALISGLEGQVINLRVTPVALEFDLFCAPGIALDAFYQAWNELGKSLTTKRLDLPAVPIVAQKIVDEARELFNEHRFWEVHEVLEGLWKTVSGSEKQLVQGLILAAAALVHAQKDENSVVWTMMTDALSRLQNQPALYYGWNIEKFRNHFAQALAQKNLNFPTV